MKGGSNNQTLIMTMGLDTTQSYIISNSKANCITGGGGSSFDPTTSTSYNVTNSTEMSYSDYWYAGDTTFSGVMATDKICVDPTSGS